MNDPLRVLKKNDTDKLGLAITCPKKGSNRYNELMSQVDNTHPIEHIIFIEINPPKNDDLVSGELEGPVYIGYQIPVGWDAGEIEIAFVQTGADQEFVEKPLNIDDTSFTTTWFTLFSPYAMIAELSEEEQAALNIDKLNDEQKAELENKIEELASQQEEKSATSAESESSPKTSSSSSAVKTGDETGYIVLMSSLMLIITGLYLELCMKKKRN